ncbi:hypothetical protein SMICM304S_03445 [Streptomyces microflavus]
MKGLADGYVVRDVATDVRLMNRMQEMEGALQDVAFDRWYALDKQHREAASTHQPFVGKNGNQVSTVFRSSTSWAACFTSAMRTITTARRALPREEAS